MQTHFTKNTAGLGSLLRATLGRNTLTKASATPLTKARTTTTTTPTRPATPRTSLFSPLFDQTRAANLAKAASTLPAPHGPRSATAPPKPPATPASVTSTSLYRRTPAQVDDADAHHHQVMRDSAAARTALLDQIKSIHARKGVSQ